MRNKSHIRDERRREREREREERERREREREETMSITGGSGRDDVRRRQPGKPYHRWECVCVCARARESVRERGDFTRNNVQNGYQTHRQPGD
jgi:hypothetical protein